MGRKDAGNEKKTRASHSRPGRGVCASASACGGVCKLLGDDAMLCAYVVNRIVRKEPKRTHNLEQPTFPPAQLEQEVLYRR